MAFIVFCAVQNRHSCIDSRERLILRLRTVHPKTITRLAQNDTGNVADRHMKQILSIYNGAGRAHSLPCKR